jgi:hypothetical protein
MRARSAANVDRELGECGGLVRHGVAGRVQALPHQHDDERQHNAVDRPHHFERATEAFALIVRNQAALADEMQGDESDQHQAAHNDDPDEPGGHVVQDPPHTPSSGLPGRDNSEGQA